MKCRINDDWDLSHVDAIVHIHTEHCRNSLFNGTFAANQFNHRRIQPYSLLSSRHFYSTSFSALPDNTGCIHVTCLQWMNISFTLCIYQLCSNGTDFFCYQCSKNLRWIYCSCRMVLNGILIQKRCSCTVSQNKSICGSTVMIGCRESLIMHSSCTTSCNDNCFGSCNGIVSGFHIQKNGSCHLSLLIFQKFYG